MSEFSDKLAFGEAGERQVRDYLTTQEQRMATAMFEFNPKTAPKIYTPTEELTSPDIISYKDGQTIFVECKRKNQWVICNPYTERETGIDAKAWRQYKKLVEISKIPIEIYFLHENTQPTGLYRVRIDQKFLDELAEDPNKVSFSVFNENNEKRTMRMILFPYELLEKIN